MVCVLKLRADMDSKVPEPLGNLPEPAKSHSAMVVHRGSTPIRRVTWTKTNMETGQNLAMLTSAMGDAEEYSSGRGLTGDYLKEQGDGEVMTTSRSRYQNIEQSDTNWSS